MKIIAKGLLLFFLFTVNSLCAQTTDTISNPELLVDPVTNCALRFYYYPNLEAYFDIKKNVYYYKESGEWITSEEITKAIKGYSVYNKLNVMITDYDDDNITLLLPIHKKKYPYSSKGRIKQVNTTKP